MTQHDDLLYFGHMLDTAHRARRLVDGIDREEFDQNETLQLALVRLVEVLGEAARNVSAGGQAGLSSVPWRDIIGMRNHLVHAYWEVNLDIVWEAVIDDLPPLIAALEAVVPAGPPDMPDPR